MHSKALMSDACVTAMWALQEQLPKRQVVLTVETTGIDIECGHRIIEIAAVELLNRRITGKRLHWYLNPDRGIDSEARAVHGMSIEFLRDKPKFSAIAGEFLDFIRGSGLVVHNAQFDMAFLDYELSLIGRDRTLDLGLAVTDTLTLARQRRPGSSNSLNSLCAEYQLGVPSDDIHGANLDAHMLAQVYLALTDRLLH
jgi:DNA polymerase-3 subunit epsilon